MATVSLVLVKSFLCADYLLIEMNFTCLVPTRPHMVSFEICPLHSLGVGHDSCYSLRVPSKESFLNVVRATLDQANFVCGKYGPNTA